ncbi:MAG: NTP transferase domain-containing protein [Anaerolineae bacterium]|nr:NTP transferase domain-containing protein [Anaerolineae bacterium]
MKAVILAGGRGQRLAPYTTILPKPLLPIDDIPILEVVIRQLKSAGFDDVTMAVGYLAELLIAYFGDGEKLGVRIRYSREEQPLGTAGPLSLLDHLDEPFLVMNGDLLTTLDYRAMWDFHAHGGTLATLATFRRSVNIDLGVIETDGAGSVTAYIEKPTYHYTVSTGIYVFDPLVLRLLSRGEKFDLPDLVTALMSKGHRVATFPFEGYWLDIGRPDDYQRALDEFRHNRARFLEGE